MLDFTIEKTGDTAILKLTENATRKRFYGFKETLMIFLGRVDHVIINITGLTEINLYCLQWLCSACNTILSLNKSVALDRDRTNTFSHAVMGSGFACRKDCVFEGKEKCILMVSGVKNLPAIIYENGNIQRFAGLPQ